MARNYALVRLVVIGLFVVLTVSSTSSAQTAPPVNAGTWQLDSKSFQAGSIHGLALDAGGLRLIAGTSGTYESLPIKAAFEFIALGITWADPLPATASAEIAVRTRPDDGEWSDWMALDTLGDHRPDSATATGTELHFAVARWFQVRVGVEDAGFSGGPLLTDLTVTYLDTRDGPDARQMTLQSSGDGPAVISRAKWGADESYRYDDAGDEIWPPHYQTPVKVIVHHTATSNDIPDPAATVRAIYYHHAVTNGWGDIGYNYLLDHEGRVYEGRYGREIDRELVIGGHAHRYNPGSIGIAVLGNFQPDSGDPEMTLPAASESTLTDLIAYTANRYGIHPLEDGYFIDDVFMNVVGHRDVGASYGATVCPGDYAYARLDEVRQNAWEHIQTLPPEVYFAEPAAGNPITDTVTIEPTVSPTIVQMELFVDSESIATDDDAPFSLTFDASEIVPGEHTVTVVGGTQNGSTGQFSRAITVADSPTPTATATSTPTTSDAGRGVVVYVPFAVAGNTSPPAPTPTATPTPIACTNLLDNGDMEEDAGWRLTTDDDFNWTSSAYYASVPHAGSHSLFVGLESGETSDTERWSSGRQTVTLPAEGDITLSLWYKPESEDDADSVDRQYVFLLDDAGNELARFLETRADSTSWQYLEVDLSAYAGQTVEVYLGTKNDGAGGATRMYVDDVTVCAQ